MTESAKVRVAINGYGVIGKRVAAAVASQEDMALTGVSDVVRDWRAHMVLQNGFRLFGARQAGEARGGRDECGGEALAHGWLLDGWREWQV